jgi:hypothetical protein
MNDARYGAHDARDVAAEALGINARQSVLGLWETLTVRPIWSTS